MLWIPQWSGLNRLRSYHNQTSYTMYIGAMSSMVVVGQQGMWGCWSVVLRPGCEACWGGLTGRHAILLLLLYSSMYLSCSRCSQHLQA